MSVSYDIWNGSSTILYLKSPTVLKEHMSSCLILMYVSLTATVVTCSVPSSPSNGKRYYRGRNYGDRVTFSCNHGYLLTGSSSRTCQSNGKWSGIQPSCISEYSLQSALNYSGGYCLPIYLNWCMYIN